MKRVVGRTGEAEGTRQVYHEEDIIIKKEEEEDTSAQDNTTYEEIVWDGLTYSWQENKGCYYVYEATGDFIGRADEQWNLTVLEPVAAAKGGKGRGKKRNQSWQQSTHGHKQPAKRPRQEESTTITRYTQWGKPFTPTFQHTGKWCRYCNKYYAGNNGECHYQWCEGPWGEWKKQEKHDEQW